MFHHRGAAEGSFIISSLFTQSSLALEAQQLCKWFQSRDGEAEHHRKRSTFIPPPFVSFEPKPLSLEERTWAAWAPLNTFFGRKMWNLTRQSLQSNFTYRRVLDQLPWRRTNPLMSLVPLWQGVFGESSRQTSLAEDTRFYLHVRSSHLHTSGPRADVRKVKLRIMVVTVFSSVLLARRSNNPPWVVCKMGC